MVDAIAKLRVDIPASSPWQKEIIGAEVMSSTQHHIVFKHKLVYTKAPLTGCGKRAISREHKLYNLLKVPCSMDIDALTTPSFGVELYALMIANNRVPRELAYADFGGPLVLALSVIDAVYRLHAVGYAHCDIQNSNVICDAKSRHVTLIDLEHSKPLTQERSTQDFRAVGFVLLETLTFRSRQDTAHCTVAAFTKFKLPQSSCEALQRLVEALIKF